MGRLLAAFVVILIVGTLVFKTEGAVEPKTPPGAGSPNAPGATPDVRHQLSTFDAPWFTARVFLPVEIPVASAWQPSSKTVYQAPAYVPHVRFVTFASGLKMLGWILIPIWVAALTGILKR